VWECMRGRVLKIAKASGTTHTSTPVGHARISAAAASQVQRF